MSVKWTARVWNLDDPRVKLGTLLVLLALADHADDAGECYPSMERIGGYARLTARQARRAVASLIEWGYVTTRSRQGGRGRASVYTLSLPEKADNLSGYAPQKADISDTFVKADNMSGYSHVNPDIYDTKADNLSGYAPQKADIYDSRRNGNPDICDRNPDISRTKADIYDRNPDMAPHTRDDPSLEPSEEPSWEPSAEVVGVPPTPPAIHTQDDAVIEASDPDAETWGDFLVAVCWLCHNHEDIGSLTENQRGALTSEAKTMRAAGTTRDHLRHWWNSVWLRDWRWTKNRERPFAKDIRSSIAATRDELAAATEMTVQAMAQRPSQPPATTRPDVAPLDATWRAVQMEALASFPPDSHARRWLVNSRLEEAGAVDGVPLYRVQLASPEGESWVRDRLSVPIRRSLYGLLRTQVLVEVTA